METKSHKTEETSVRPAEVSTAVNKTTVDQCGPYCDKQCLCDGETSVLSCIYLFQCTECVHEKGQTYCSG
jgi:hypothetical protein